MDTVEITAGRLHLRPWLPRDAAEVQAICSDPVIARWTRVPEPYTAQDAASYVGEVSPRGWDAGTDAHFAVLDATTGGVLASVSLMGIGDGRAELGLWVGPQARGAGVGADASAAVCRWAFAELGLRRVAWLADVDNAASIRCAQKAGFVHEGVLRARLDVKGRVSDAWLGARLATD